MSPGVAMPCPASPPIPIAKSTLAIVQSCFFRLQQMVFKARHETGAEYQGEKRLCKFLILRMALLLLAMNCHGRHDKEPKSPAKCWQKDMLSQFQTAPAIEAELHGDLTPFLEQLGSPDGLAALAGAGASLAALTISPAAGLRSFLAEYHARILQPLELPAIQRAFVHGERNELRELIAFDQSLASEMSLKDFSSASRVIGVGQLQRLRPLRDQRLARRYLAAVENGQAHGWHTLVYGLTLAIYSLPLRPGLIGYAQRATRGFIRSAARSLRLSEADSESLEREFSACLPAAVEPLLRAGINFQTIS
jgi:urease accessory protein UreF